MRRGLALAFAALAALPAAAAAQEPEAPEVAGLGLILGGALPTAHHDTGEGPLLGDDTVLVESGLAEAGLAWEGAPIGTGLHAGLRGARLHHGFGSLAAERLAALEGAVPAEMRAAWPYVGPDGFDVSLRFLDFERVGGEDPMRWPDAWAELGGWGPSYDSVLLPEAVGSNTDEAIVGHYRSLTHACNRAEAIWGVRPAGCDGLDEAALQHLPDVGFVGNVANVRVGASPVVSPGRDVLSSHSAREGAQGGLGSLAPGIDATLLGPGSDALLPEPGGDADLGPGPAPFAPWSVAQLAFVHPLGGSAALPLALAALGAPLLAWALYRRILPHRALHHPVREDLLHRVRAHPGIHESQLAREMGLRHTHVQYHLRVLSEAGIVELRRFGGLKCIFELGRLSSVEKAHALTERGRSRSVLEGVGAEPGIAQRDLARRVGMSESSIKWHLDRLEQAGLVRTERARGAKRAWVQPGALAAPPLPTPMPRPLQAAPLAAPPVPL